jgi:hypothetical protein
LGGVGGARVERSAKESDQGVAADGGDDPDSTKAVSAVPVEWRIQSRSTAKRLPVLDAHRDR